MKTLGFIVGNSWHDPEKYYLLLNEGSTKANGGQIILSKGNRNNERKRRRWNYFGLHRIAHFTKGHESRIAFIVHYKSSRQNGGGFYFKLR